MTRASKPSRASSTRPDPLLGLDIGTSRIKAVLIDAAGGELAASSVATPFAPSAAGTEMAVADLERALRDVVAKLGPIRRSVAAVGVAGMAESGAPWRAGRPVGPIIAWHDGRGEETVASLEARFGSALRLWTGRRVRTVSSVAKLGWLLDQGLPPPDRWLGVPELALFALTGESATEHSLAARTGAYHVIERQWLPDVVAHLDLPADLFPEVRRAGTPMGWVSAGAARIFGLPAGVPVTVAGHDHLAAAAGLGARADDLLNSVGTAETVLRRLHIPPDVERALALDLAVTVWPGGEAWCVLASATRSGLVIEALAAHLRMSPLQLDELVAAGRPRGGSAPGPTDAPRAPTPQMPGHLVALAQGIEVPDGRPDEMWTATLTALAHRTADAAQRVAALAGPPRRLVMFGGGSRSRVWSEVKAAVLGIPVLSFPAAEAAARGAALVGGVAAGWWPSLAAAPPLDLSGPDRRT